MNRTSRYLATFAAAWALSACGSGGDDTPQVKVDDLSAGSYVVSIGDANTPTVGKYYASADGSRLLVVADANDRASQLYRRTASEGWVAAPGFDKDVAVALLRSSAVTANSVALASAAGRYVTSVSTGITANFSISASGDIVAGASACKLSGKLSTNSLPNTLKLSLASFGCGSLPATSTGVLTVDGDYAPAAFRLVADDGTQVVDLWGFSE